jgi:hypothetical protein
MAGGAAADVERRLAVGEVRRVGRQRTRGDDNRHRQPPINGKARDDDDGGQNGKSSHHAFRRTFL